MRDLLKQINKIKKGYFSFADLRKIAQMNDTSLSVTIYRLVAAGELEKLVKGYYCVDRSKVDYLKMALEIYKPSYLSFEWALGQSGILSQKSYALTLATTKRARQAELGDMMASYHHLRNDLFFGYILQDGYPIAESEKAFLDLAYLSLNGYAKFDPEEMNLRLLNKDVVRKYLKKFNNERLEKVVNEIL